MNYGGVVPDIHVVHEPAFSVTNAPTSQGRGKTYLLDVIASKRLSQADVAKQANVTRGSVSHYIYGRMAQVGSETKMKIEKALIELGCMEARSPIIVLDMPRFANIRFDREAA